MAHKVVSKLASLTILLLLTIIATATASSNSYAASKSSVRLVHVPAGGVPSLLHGGGGSAVVKVVQSGSRYGNAGAGYYSHSGYSGSTGGYVYYDQLPSYGYGYGGTKGYSGTTNSKNSYGTSSGSSKGYVYYDQLPSYGYGYGEGYGGSQRSRGSKGYVYYDQLPSYGSYGNDHSTSYAYGYDDSDAYAYGYDDYRRHGGATELHGGHRHPSPRDDRRHHQYGEGERGDRRRHGHEGSRHSGGYEY